MYFDALGGKSAHLMEEMFDMLHCLAGAFQREHLEYMPQILPALQHAGDAGLGQPLLEPKGVGEQDLPLPYLDERRGSPRRSPNRGENSGRLQSALGA